MLKNVFVFLFCLIFSITGLNFQKNNQNNTISEASKEVFNSEITHAIFISKEEVTISSNRLSRDKIESYNSYLQELKQKDFFCLVFLDDISIKENGKDFQLNLKYKSDFFLPLYFTKNKDNAVKELNKAFSNKPTAKITMIFDCDDVDDEDLFSVLDSAEINLSSCPFEAENVYFERYEKERGKTIVNMWLGFEVSEEEINLRKKELDLMVRSYADNISSKKLKSNREKYKAVFDLISENVSYDEGQSALTSLGLHDKESALNRTAYGALVKGESICSGYARAFKAICDELSLPCWVVVGEKDGVKHAWNVVKIDKQNFFVDTTASSQGEREENSFLIQEEKLSSLGYSLNDYFIIPKRL